MDSVIEDLYKQVTATDVDRDAAIDLIQRLIDKRRHPVAAPAAETSHLMVFEERWCKQALEAAQSVLPRPLTCVVSCEWAELLTPQLNAVLGEDIGIVSGPVCTAGGTAIDKSHYEAAFSSMQGQFARLETLIFFGRADELGNSTAHANILALLQVLYQLDYLPRRLVLSACYQNAFERCCLEAWLGYQRSLGLILPDTAISVFIHQAADDNSVAPEEPYLNRWLCDLRRELGGDLAGGVIYADNKRYISRIEETPLENQAATDATQLLKTGGTYLITGGSGGLGLIFARHLLSLNPQIHLVLIGRRPLTAERQASIAALSQTGATIEYLQQDICAEAALQKSLTEIKQRCGAIDGLIHAAGVESRASVLDKDYAEFARVLAPKIQGTVVLDRVLADEPLAFVCYFSSSAAVLGDFGVCDYAVANRFQMAYGRYRQQLVGQGILKGKTLVINWPLWADGGMASFKAVDDNQLYLRSSGQRALQTAEGLAVFDRLLGGEKTQQLVLVGERERIAKWLLPVRHSAGQAPASAPASRYRSEMADLSLVECIARDIREQIGQLLGTLHGEVEGDRNLGDYGLESIHLTELAKRLSRHFQLAVTPALFFSKVCVDALVEHFYRNYHGHFQALYQRPSDPPSTVATAVDTDVRAPTLAQVDTTTQTAPSPPSSSAHSGETALSQPIAIIGMSGRFPGARNVEDFWRLLESGSEAVVDVPAERAAGYTGVTALRAGLIDGPGEFDPLFFAIAPAEAELMDPRQRLLLQETWNALEDAAYGREALRRETIAVFVGVEQGDYQRLLQQAGRDDAALTANHDAVLASRLSYHLDLRGPVVAINTACSSGLVAAHQACNSLRIGECDSAVVAAVNLLLTGEGYNAMDEAGMLSPSGRCRTFDRRADGMVPGEAVAALMLKTLARAEADRDPIRAVIRAGGINYDGRTNGITAPNGDAQTRLLRRTYDQYHIDPVSVGYIIAHGTATQLGDPVEIDALSEAFQSGVGQRGHCALTSTKTNIGHTFAASGLVSLIALVAALTHRRIPASLHCDSESAHVAWQDSPFYVNKCARDWPAQAPLGAVSAFGMSGTNAHMVLADYRRELPLPQSASHFLLPLSAKSAVALQSKARQLAIWLQQQAEVSLLHVSFTLLLGRQHFNHRCALVVGDIAEAVEALEQLTAGQQPPNVFLGEVGRDFIAQPSVVESAQALLQRAAGQVRGHSEGERQQQLRALADWYCQGYDLPWERLFADTPATRISLPAYPFARDTYWYTPLPAQHNESLPALFVPQWQRSAAPAVTTDIDSRHHWVMVLGDCASQWRQHLQAALTPEHCEYLPLMASSSDAPLATCFERCVEAVFARLQSLLERCRTARQTLQVLVDAEDTAAQIVSAGISALLKTASLEDPRLSTQCLRLDASIEPQSLPQLLRRNAAAPQQRDIRYRRGEREVQLLQAAPVPVDKQRVISPWRPGGIYLISGGLGGLGWIFARAIAAQAAGATLLLIGRRPLDAAGQAQLDKLTALGAKASYAAMDICDAEALTNFLVRQRDIDGPLSGVLHCAGVVEDSFLASKTPDQWRRVMAAKVGGLVNLDRATAGQPLQYFLLFSSLAAVFGNVGQGDYAAANAFMDSYAHYRNQLLARGERSGHTLAINWPWWRDGGMQLDSVTGAALVDKGLLPLNTDAGIDAAARAWQLAQCDNVDQVLVIAGEKFARSLNGESAPVSAQSAVPSEPVPAAALQSQTLARLHQLFAEVTKIPLTQIDVDEVLEHYGIDSLMINRLNRALEAFIGELPKTLFFEFNTLVQLAAYLTANYSEDCRRWTGLNSDTQESAASGATSVPVETAISQYTDGVVTEVKDTETDRTVSGTVTDRAVAIIGLHGRYPAADTPAQFWDNLAAGRECIAEIPPERWDLEDFYRADPDQAVAEGKSYSKWGGFLDGFAHFDPLFFGISPREAADMDPQERLFIQCCWAALEDAGYTRARLAYQHRSRVGVFAGITKTGFELYGPGLWQRGESAFPHTSFSSVANRVSYLFDLHGPSLPIDTMCSASLTAVHEACEHLLREECEVALAGGVNLYLHPSSYVALCARRMLSSDRHCRSFGAGGHGFVPGEGVGVVILKPLAAAERDRDRVMAVIRASSINHGGRTQGYSVPNPRAQAALIESALVKAGVDARSISYVEAHGTGTELGDPIEIRGLSEAFARRGGARQADKPAYCAIGSAKSNLGHLEAAAGIAGLTKIVLQLQHRQLAPSLHSASLNPNIAFEKTPFYVQQELAPWPAAAGEPRRASLSSFGAGGANAHVIIEEYSVAPAAAVEPSLPVAIVLSAKTAAQLRTQAENLAVAIANSDWTESDLPRIAYTLQVGREAMAERLGLISTSLAELRADLQAFIDGETVAEETIAGEIRSRLFRGRLDKDKDSVSSFANALFKGHGELQQVVDQWLVQGDFAAVLKLWVNGLHVDWAHCQLRLQMVSLPTYPFAREIFWLDDTARQSQAPLSNAAHRSPGDTSAAPAYPLMTFSESWSLQPLDNEVAEAKDVFDNVIFFVNDTAAKQALDKAVSLIATDIEVQVVVKARQEQLSDSGDCTVDGSDRESYRRLFDIMAQRLCGNSAIVFWQRFIAAADGAVAPAWEENLACLQALAQTRFACCRLLLTGAYRDALERSYLDACLGFERSLRLVLPNTAVAIAASDGDALSAAWLQNLWRELRARDFRSTFHIASKRYISVVSTEAPTESRTAPQPPQPLLKTRGTYLITGGCGALGGLFADFLHCELDANIVLTGRSATGRADLQQLGERVCYFRADSADAAAMATVVAETERRFGKIDGLIHAAGIQQLRSVFEAQAVDFQTVLSAKIRGTQVLSALFAERPVAQQPDFICHFSSAAAILGDFGSCDYAIGNRFQQVYPRYLAQQSPAAVGKTLVINWPLWRDGGMQSRRESTEMYLHSSGQRELQTAEGLALFERLLQVAADSPETVVQRLVLAGEPERLRRFLGIAERTVASRSDGTEVIELDERIVADLKQIVSDLLNIARERVELHCSLADFGFDSIRLAEFAQQLAARYDTVITPAIFFTHSTLAELCTYLLRDKADAVQQHYAGRDQAAPVAPAVPVVTARAVELTTPAEVEAATATEREGVASAPEAVAVIGLSGRFPGARTAAQFWQLLEQGVDAVDEIPAERFDWRRYFKVDTDDDRHGHCIWSGALSGVAEFDPLFFEISPGEAELMDPRQRLLLQESWLALEDAAYGDEALQREKIAVYVGVEQGDYQHLLQWQGQYDTALTANHDAILASRLSYYLNLRGPVMAINTTCSSGLVAAHQACLSLRAGECDSALVGAANLLLTADSYIGMEKAGMLSASGRCRVFDRRADGMVPGEAVTVAMLKTLARARADGDNIRAVICASGVNYDGKTNGITAPSGEAQTQLLDDIYTRYKIDAQQIGHIVTHGTGTRLGDPVEINALYAAYQPRTDAKAFCALTSTKANIGHTFAASGLVSLIALVQGLERRKIPPSLHCDTENDYIDWRESPFYVNKTCRDWPADRPLGAVSAFGMSGTNAHMVLASYRCDASTPAPQGFYLLPLSARTEPALRERAGQLQAWLQRSPQTLSLADVSYTLMLGRRHFQYRGALVVRDPTDALEALAQLQSGEASPNVFRGKVERSFNEQALISDSVQDLSQRASQISAERSGGEWQKILRALGEYYCRGYQPPWRALFADMAARRIELPGYPFSRKIYWLPASEVTAVAPSPTTSSSLSPGSAAGYNSGNGDFYRQLIKDVVDDAVSIDAAIARTRDYMAL